MEIKKINLEEVKELRNKNYEFLILQGCGGDLNQWVKGITDTLKEEEVLPLDFSFDEVYSFKNKDLTNLAFALNSEDINIGRLAILRIKMRQVFGSMWLSDYLDNGYIEEENI